MDASVLAMLMWLTQVTGYTIPEHHNVVITKISSAEMAERACGISKDKQAEILARKTQENASREFAVPIKVCKALGFYQDSNEDVIYIENDLPADVEDSVTVHELSHWLQHFSGKFDLNSCDDTYKREVESFRIQNYYIQSVENKFEMYGTPAYACEQKDSKQG